MHSPTISTDHSIPPALAPLADTFTPKLLQTKNKLWFVQYTPGGTIDRRWYLVQVDLEALAALYNDFTESVSYYCYFLAKHPSDAGKSDDFSRWWKDWYNYTTVPTTKNIIFGDRILFRPNIFLDQEKYSKEGNIVWISLRKNASYWVHLTFNNYLTLIIHVARLQQICCTTWLHFA